MNSFSQKEGIYVHPNKFCITSSKFEKKLRSVLGICVSLTGIKQQEKEIIAFMTHLMFPQNGKAMIEELRKELFELYNLQIEDFDIYISGGKTIKKNKYTGMLTNPGKENTEETIKYINKKPNEILLNTNDGICIEMNIQEQKYIAKPIKIPENQEKIEY